jgi:putative membrane protein
MRTWMPIKRHLAARRHLIVLLAVLSTTSLANGQIWKLQTRSLDGERAVLNPAGAGGVSSFDHGNDLQLAETAAAVLLEADAQPNSAAAAAPNVAPALSPVDANFVAQANLGAPFQIDSGRIAEEKAATADLRNYAHLMVVTHIPVVDNLNAILQRKGIPVPPETLLQGAYNTMIASLKADIGAAFDRDYVQGQVDYQKGNAALFRYEIQNGTDPDLKEFAERTLPKIDDHLQWALKLANSDVVSGTSPD